MDTSLSREQLALYEHFTNVSAGVRNDDGGIVLQNAVVNACAGGGKSSVCYEIAKTLAKRDSTAVIYMTYSSVLKNEARRRLNEYRDLVDIHSIHSAVMAYFGQPCNSDHQLTLFASKVSSVTTTTTTNSRKLSRVRLLIVDEAQDTNSTHHTVIKHILKFCHPRCQMLVIGDIFQQIYNRDLSKLYDVFQKPMECFETKFNFKPFRLSVSFRITIPMARYVNAKLNPAQLRTASPVAWQKYGKFLTDCWGQGITGRPGSEMDESVSTVCVSDHNTSSLGTKPLMDYLRDILRRTLDVHSPSELMVIGRSVKSHTPVGRLVKLYHERAPDVPWYRNDSVVNNIASNSGNLDAILRNKATYSTIHSAKGLGKKHVMFIGFDENLLSASLREGHGACLAWCLAYVALTRASDKLTVVTYEGVNNIQSFPACLAGCIVGSNKISRLKRKAFPKRQVCDTVRNVKIGYDEPYALDILTNGRLLVYNKPELHALENEGIQAWSSCRARTPYNTVEYMQDIRGIALENVVFQITSYVMRRISGTMNGFKTLMESCMKSMDLSYWKYQFERVLRMKALSTDADVHDLQRANVLINDVLNVRTLNNMVYNAVKNINSILRFCQIPEGLKANKLSVKRNVKIESDDFRGNIDMVITHVSNSGGDDSHHISQSILLELKMCTDVEHSHAMQTAYYSVMMSNDSDRKNRAFLLYPVLDHFTEITGDMSEFYRVHSALVKRSEEALTIDI